MKTKNVYLLTMLVLTLFSCESREEYGSSVWERNDMIMNIVKMSNPEYLQYVVADNVPFSVNSDRAEDPDSNLYQIRGSGAVYEELYIGTTPYIDLGQNYYLVDWKWGNFLYAPTNVLIDVNWEEVKSRKQVWGIEIPSVSGCFMLEHEYVSRKKVDGFLKITSVAPIDAEYNLSADYIKPEFLWHYNCLEELMLAIADSTVVEGFKTLEAYNTEVARQDSLQGVFTKRLRRIIADGKWYELINYQKGR